jgi:hypothetical protein
MKQTQGRKKETDVEQEGSSSLKGLLGGRGKKSTPGQSQDLVEKPTIMNKGRPKKSPMRKRAPPCVRLRRERQT